MSAQRIGNAEVIEQLPHSLRRQLIYERFHLHARGVYQDTSVDPDFDTRYLPQNCNAIKLPCFWVPRKHFYVFGDQSRTRELAVLEGVGSSARVLLPIHPTSLPHYRDFLQSSNAVEANLHIWAVPTASTRTFLAWPDQRPEEALFERRRSIRQCLATVVLT